MAQVLQRDDSSLVAVFDMLVERLSAIEASSRKMEDSVQAIVASITHQELSSFEQGRATSATLTCGRPVTLQKRFEGQVDHHHDLVIAVCKDNPITCRVQDADLIDGTHSKSIEQLIGSMQLARVRQELDGARQRLRVDLESDAFGRQHELLREIDPRDAGFTEPGIHGDNQSHLIEKLICHKLPQVKAVATRWAATVIMYNMPLATSAQPASLRDLVSVVDGAFATLDEAPPASIEFYVIDALHGLNRVHAAEPFFVALVHDCSLEELHAVYDQLPEPAQDTVSGFFQHQLISDPNMFTYAYLQVWNSLGL